MLSTLRLVFWLAALAAALAPSLAAADPPARVGRLAVIDDGVTFRIDRQDAGSPAATNWPVSSGAILDTDRGGRAEVWVGSTAYRLGGDSRVEFGTIDDQVVSLNQATGSLAVTIRDRDQADDVEIRTPEGRVQFAVPGRYRIDTDRGRTTVTVRSGTAWVYGPERSLSVAAGQSAEIDAQGGEAVFDSPPRDGFDDWVASRDAATEARTARRYVSPAMTGYQDLDAYGTWGAAPDYGTVWYPSAVPVGWAPYRYGRWAWVPPWGWTWVDAAPWGFAPFHYGRWLYIDGRWGWIPGAYVARPVYAPALVAWVGNPGWSLSLSIGSGPAVGWFPLAPREVYVPAYRVSPTYVHKVNVTHVTNVTVIDRAVAGREPPRYRHRELDQAVTMVPANTVRDGRPINAGAVLRHDHREIAKAPVSAKAPTTNWLSPSGTAFRPGKEGGGHRRDADVPRGSGASEADGGDRRQRREAANERSASPVAPATPATRTTPAIPASPATPAVPPRREAGKVEAREAPGRREPGTPPRTTPEEQRVERPAAAEPPRGKAESREDRPRWMEAPQEKDRGKADNDERGRREIRVPPAPEPSRREPQAPFRSGPGEQRIERPAAAEPLRGGGDSREDGGRRMMSPRGPDSAAPQESERGRREFRQPQTAEPPRHEPQPRQPEARSAPQPFLERPPQEHRRERPTGDAPSRPQESFRQAPPQPAAAPREMQREEHRGPSSRGPEPQERKGEQKKGKHPGDRD